MGRSGFFGSLALIKAQSVEESELLLVICDNCVSNVQPTKLRRARDGLWTADALKAISAAWREGKQDPGSSPTLANGSLADVSQGTLGTLCHTLRRLSAYLAAAPEPTIEVVGPSLLAMATTVFRSMSLEAAGSQVAVRRIHEAILRLAYAWRSKAESEVLSSLLQETMLRSLEAGVEGLREDLLRCWHTTAA